MKTKALTILLFLGLLNFSGLGVSIETVAYYNDTESSTGNKFAADMLDFRLSNPAYESLIGPEALGEVNATTVAIPESGSMDMRYTVSATSTGPFDALCDALEVEAKRNGLTQYEGPLSGLSTPATTGFGSWEFQIDLPPLASAGHGDKCEMNALFTAWRAEVGTAEESGYRDEERFSFSFTARMVVLNEIFPRPSDVATAPKNREYIELYNNGSTPVDVLGWKITEMTEEGAETNHSIVASGAMDLQMQSFEGGTIIPAGGFLTLFFGGSSSYLDDSGDTVKFYDSSNVLLDSHIYPSTAVGKAHARFPDGIGFWVDPDPTPGGQNKVSLQDLETAGFDKETIRQILEMVALKGAPIPENETGLPTEDSIIIKSESATSTDEKIEIAALETETATSTEMILEKATSTEILIEETKGGAGSASNDELSAEETIIAREEDIIPPEPAPEKTIPKESEEAPMVSVVAEETPVVTTEETLVAVEDMPVEQVAIAEPEDAVGESSQPAKEPTVETPLKPSNEGLIEQATI